MKTISKYKREKQEDKANSRKEFLDKSNAWMDKLDQKNITPWAPSEFDDSNPENFPGFAEKYHSTERQIRIITNLRNNIRSGRYELIENGKVVCDYCFTEIVNSSPGMILTSNPPKINVACPGCGWTGYLEAQS